MQPYPASGTWRIDPDQGRAISRSPAAGNGRLRLMMLARLGIGLRVTRVTAS
jgi:hypothetical protein